MIEKHPDRLVEKAITGHAAEEQARPRAGRRSSRSTPARSTRTPPSSRPRSRSRRWLSEHPRDPEDGPHDCEHARDHPPRHHDEPEAVAEDEVPEEAVEAEASPTSSTPPTTSRRRRRPTPTPTPTSTTRSPSRSRRWSRRPCSPTARSRPSAAARRPSSASASCPAAASSRSTASRLEEYFPNKLHQQLIREPLVTAREDRALRHLRPPARWRHVRPGRRAAPGHRPRADRGRLRGPPAAQEGRLPHPRPARDRAQEVRPQEGPQGASVQQALRSNALAVVSRTFRHRRRSRPGQRRAPHPGARRCAVRVRCARARRARPVPPPGRGRRSGSRAPAARCWRPRSSPGSPPRAPTRSGVGVLPTPAVAHLVGALGADLGVMISASHNPMPDNGIKLFAAGGHKLADALEDAIEAGMDRARPAAHRRGHRPGPRRHRRRRALPRRTSSPPRPSRSPA